MADERMRILTMLSEGKISAEEAEKLIDALKNQETAAENKTKIADVIGNKNLYVKVDPKNGKSSDYVSIKIPFALLKAGINIAGLIPKEAQEKINTSMNEKGMNFTLSDIKPENIQEIMAALEDFSIDIDTDEAAIKVYCS